MPNPLAFPFILKRGSDVIGGLEISSTTETIHGLLCLHDDRLTIQWRRSRSTEIVGFEIRTEKEHEPVRETSLPISALAGAVVRWRWHRWPPGRYLVLTAADLQAFAVIGGDSGLRLDHPAELEIRVRRADRAAAEEFAGELSLAVAERALRSAESPTPLGDAGPAGGLLESR
jgi:hypothetical protein